MHSYIKRADEFVFGRFKQQHERLLEQLCRDRGSLLDVGCGSNSPIQRFSSQLERSVGVDAHLPSIDRSREQGIHTDYVQCDVLDILNKFGEKSFDVVVANDLIEHLDKAQGESLIAQMEAIARRRVVIFTPNGFLQQGEFDNNPYQVHRSGWTVKEMRGRGYDILGVNGWRPLRTERAIPRFYPRVVWKRISLLTQPFTTYRPSMAFSILCAKDIA
jgi:predicted TPR repeat methyltransferase